jgi:D-lactate dehydrogenase (cytochrome)
MASGEVRLNATPALACPPKPDCLIPKPALEALISILGDRPPFGLAERAAWARRILSRDRSPRCGLLRALHGGGVAHRACLRRPLAIIPFGAGTSLEGHVAALKGGLCIDLSRMTRIIAVHFDPGGESTSHPRLRHQCGPLRETMRENVVSLIAVIADGQVVRTASRARKSSAGSPPRGIGGDAGDYIIFLYKRT